MASIFRRNPKKRTEEPVQTVSAAEFAAGNNIIEEQNQEISAESAASADVFALPLEDYVAAKVAGLGASEDDFMRFTLELQVKREAQTLQKSQQTVPQERRKTVPAEQRQAILREGPQGVPAERRLDNSIDKIFAFGKRRRAFAVRSLKWNSYKLGRVWKRRFAPVWASCWAKEAAFSEKLGSAVERFDLWQEAAGEKQARTIAGVFSGWRTFKEKAEQNKREILAGAAGAAVCCAVFTMVVGATTVYEYSYNGKFLGTVKDPQDVLKTVSIIGSSLNYVYGAEVQINAEEDITFERVNQLNPSVDSKEDILNTLTYMRDMQVSGYALYVGDTRLALLQSEEAVNQILSSIKQGYLSEGKEYVDVGFAEEIRIEEISTRLGNLDDEEQAMEYISTGGVQETVYQVQSGDTFSEIAKNWGISQPELLAFNPGVTPEKLQIGQELVMSGTAPLLTVRTTEIATYKEAIQYEIEYEETSSLYVGETTVKKSGTSGERQVVAKITRNNGAEIGREEISQEILSEPTSQIVLTGTKELPPLIGTGTFVYPVRGYTLTSTFGTRWGRSHTGIDMAASKGTSIYATDGGEVISAGWEGAKGYCIRINHGKNVTSVYAHLSSMLVSRGDKVYQGQKIGLMGSTGYSTGSHLHFEILVNGVAKNPFNYI